MTQVKYIMVNEKYQGHLESKEHFYLTPRGVRQSCIYWYAHARQSASRHHIPALPGFLFSSLKNVLQSKTPLVRSVVCDHFFKDLSNPQFQNN